MKKTLLCILATLPALTQPGLAQSPAPHIDNDRVTVRDIPLQPGTPGPAIQHAGDYAILYLTGGRIRTADGKTITMPSGGASFGHGGTTSDTALGAPVHQVVIELKNAPSKSVPNTSGLPPAFPRPGSKKILENERVWVWNYAWQAGKPTPMHFHSNEVVVVYRGDGDVSSTTPDGKVATTHHNPGDIVYNLPNRTHFEQLVKGQQSAIMLELK